MMNQVSVFDVLRFVWRYWRRAPRLLAGSGTLMLAATVCDVFMPVMAGQLIDALTNNVAGQRPLAAALWALGGVVGLSVAFHGFREVSARLWIHLATRVMRRLVADSFHRVQRFSASWHANSFAGATVRKVSRGMWAYDLFADTIYMGIMPSAVVLVGVTALLFAHWPLMGVYVLLAVALYVGISVGLVTKYVAPANKLQNEADSAIGAAMADAITCNATVKSFGRESREDRRFGRVVELWRLRALKGWLRDVNTGGAQSVLTIALQLGLLGLALWFWSRGTASPGDVAFVLTSYLLVNGYLRDIGMHVRNLQRSVDEIRDVVEFDKQAFDVADPPGALPLVARRGEIVFDRVTFSYANQTAPIYQDFSLTIAPGERVALVGRSGSGKSTFVSLIQRFYDVDGGSIAIDGRPIEEATQTSVRRAIALVPQDPVLFHRSLAENIAYARPTATSDEIVRAARMAHADDFIRGLENGYDTLVGERGVKLSGGERQRIAIARAFLADAPILVLDEATSSLDSVTEGLIQEAIEELMRGRTTIVIAHRLSTVRRVDRILVFHAGSVVEQGRHDELLNRRDGVYRELFTRQAEGLAG